MNLCDRDTIRALLERHGFRFSKSMGQNFLTDPQIPADIAAASGADENCGVLEIGPGIGPLTAELARRAGMSEVYLYQVFSGRRRPSRDRLLCLCIGLESELEEAQLLLKRMGYAPLYPRLKRDAIISHGLLHYTPLGEINNKLFSENEKTLF